jgi:tetratricopeptide (TPR) repeat protein/predicted Ser/Thr protein kinase
LEGKNRDGLRSSSHDTEPLKGHPFHGMVEGEGLSVDSPLKQMGKYRIEGVLGSGGMGKVYLARQENPDRQVALKVIRTEHENPRLIKRFELEARVLGRLQHPGIAQIYEADIHDGAFFFAMEYVRGPSLKAYVEKNKLTTRQCMELLIKICEAVQHAHQRGIIHRDLKPANILVEESGQPKVLDFGVARATDGDIQTTTFLTEVGQLVGTLHYMSPEQVAGDPDEIDTRTDVYSLGVIAFEMLTGGLPFDFRGMVVTDIMRTILEEEPERLSSIDQEWRGDLDTIISKAMEKDRARRYQSASELAADIRCHLNDQPIMARPPSWFYQVRKFARRNRALVSGVVAAFVVLVAGIIATGFALSRETEQRRLKEAEALRARAALSESEAVTQFLVDTLMAADPYEESRRDVLVREVMDRAAESVGREFADKPKVEARLRSTIGRVYTSLGEFALAEPQLTAAFSLLKNHSAEDHQRIIRSRGDLAKLYFKQARFQESLDKMNKTLEESRRHLGEDHPDTIRILEQIAGILIEQGKLDEAEKRLERELEHYNEVRPDLAEGDLKIKYHLATVFVNQGRLAEAEDLYLEILDRLEHLNNTLPFRSHVINALAALYDHWARFDKSEPLYREARELAETLFGEEHPNTLIVLNNLALCYTRMKQYDKAEPLYFEVLDVWINKTGESHTHTLLPMNNLALLYDLTGRYGEAEALFEKMLKLQRELLGDNHHNTLLTMHNLGGLYAKQDRFDEAEPLLAEAVRRLEETMPPSFYGTAITTSRHANCLTSLGRFEEAEKKFFKAYEALEVVFGADHPNTVKVVQQMVSMYEKWEKPDEMARWRDHLVMSQEGAAGDVESDAMASTKNTPR